MQSSSHSQELVLAFHADSRDVGYDLRRAARAFELIHDLGGNGVRFDLSWFDVEPDKEKWDRNKIRWYKEFFCEATRTYGLVPIVVLIGTPRWATNLRRRNTRAFLQHWLTFCERACEVMDGRVHLVQVWNEPNNPVLQVAEPANPDVGILNSSFFHELLNATAARLRPAVTPLEIIINVCTDIPFWEHFTDECIRKVNAAFDIVGIDYYPGTYFQNNWRQFPLLERVLRRMNDPNDLWFSKQAALVEFGYSTFLPPLRSEARQREWIEAVMRVVRDQNEVWRRRQAKSLRLISWYELFDEPTRLPLNFLAHFGIMRSPRSDGIASAKLGYDVLRAHLQALRAASERHLPSQQVWEAFKSA